MPEKTARTSAERARTPKAVKRVPNVARTAATRAKLLKATVECLYELGYHQTSTVVVTERAKVSRGAMLHHFPTKADLMMATMGHIRELRGDMHRERLDKLKTDRDKFLHLIDVLWEANQTPSGIARIEIMLGSRCDPELGPRFRILHDELEERHKQRVWERAESMGIRDRRKIDAFVQLYAAALRGLAIDTLFPNSRAGLKDSIALMKEFQLRMLEDLTPGKKR